MMFDQAVTLKMNEIRLEPLDFSHEAGLQAACQDGELWKLRVTSAPHFSDVKEYIELALQQKEKAERFAFAVIDDVNNKILGTTSYHDILPNVKRLEVGYTWYAKCAQRTHVNTTCKFLMLQHAFESLDANVVGLRTDCLNFNSQRAIERLGAKKDGVIRGHVLRKDGTIRDTVMYSILQSEWINIRAHLLHLLDRE